MNLFDLVLLGLWNMWRTKLRTFLTVLGVVIGIGALTSMVSFGTGMQKNITDAFESNDLFTSLTVTPKKIDLDGLASGDASSVAGAMEAEEVPLTDSILQQIAAMPGVALAYPNIEFPARVKMMDDSASFRINALPAEAGRYKPYNELLAGSFFTSDSDTCVVIREETLQMRFKIRLLKDDGEQILSHGDSLKGIRLMHPDSLINTRISLITMSLNMSKVPMAMMGALAGKSNMPVDEVLTVFTICGIMKSRSQFGPDGFGGNIFVPVNTARQIPQLGFTSVWDLLDDRKQEGTHASIHVKLEGMEWMDPVKAGLEEMGVGVFTITDQLSEIRRAFLILNAALGFIGAIALLVAGLGITNTMVMSILERTREIGIMKSIGGSERQIRAIFFVEASAIGLVGALFGLVLGWAVTLLANYVMNTHVIPEGTAAVDLFYFPLWLIFGAIAFAIVISLIAGLYPAIRASRVDPVKALRHD